jgi:hypothetical protein
MNPITITRALVELKTLNDRINKSTERATFIRVNYPDKQQTDNFGKLAQESLQSIRDLIKYRAALKGAIVKSNAETVVNIAGKEYTVAEAIERKSSINYEKTLLEKINKQYRISVAECENHNCNAENRLERMLTAEIGKDKRTDPEIVKTLTEGYRKANLATMDDPLGLPVLIAKMEEDMATFQAEVDITLSESNSRTMISVVQ